MRPTQLVELLRVLGRKTARDQTAHRVPNDSRNLLHSSPLNHSRQVLDKVVERNHGAVVCCVEGRDGRETVAVKVVADQAEARGQVGAGEGRFPERGRRPEAVHDWRRESKRQPRLSLVRERKEACCEDRSDSQTIAGASLPALSSTSMYSFFPLETLTTRLSCCVVAAMPCKRECECAKTDVRGWGRVGRRARASKLGAAAESA